MAIFHTERGLDRLVNFTDAAVAIAITLLILPLVDIAGEIDHESLGRLLDENTGALIGFAITFAVIGNFWIVHHAEFEVVDSYSLGLIWANMLWLFSIVFLPFAANLLSLAPAGNSGVYAIYIGTMVVCSGSMLLIGIILRRNPSLMRPETRGSINLVDSIVPTTTLVVCLCLAVIFPTVGIWWLLLLFLQGQVQRLISRWSKHARVHSGQ